MKGLLISVSVPENEIGKITEGQKAYIGFKALNIDSIVGHVDCKTVIADPLTRAYTIKISIPPNDKILPGMVCDVNIIDNNTDNADSTQIILPSQSVLLNSDNKTFVWIVQNGHANQRYVTADELSSGGIVVRQGLMSGDSVIVAGMQKVGIGTPVTTVTE